MLILLSVYFGGSYYVKLIPNQELFKLNDRNSIPFD